MMFAPFMVVLFLVIMEQKYCPSVSICDTEGQKCNLFYFFIGSIDIRNESSIDYDVKKVEDVLLKNKEALLNIASSSNVMEQIKLCCNKVIYNKQKFSMELFEDEKARGDFFSVMVIVGLENIRPFFPSLHMFFDAIASLFLKA